MATRASINQRCPAQVLLHGGTPRKCCMQVPRAGAPAWGRPAQVLMHAGASRICCMEVPQHCRFHALRSKRKSGRAGPHHCGCISGAVQREHGSGRH
eukprot:364080-Chlamydomonas_euryale.AAC.3